MVIKRSFALIHKWAALVLGLLLLIQVTSGILISFRHEISDSLFRSDACGLAVCEELAYPDLHRKFTSEHQFADLFDVEFPARPGSPYQFSYDNGKDHLPVVAYVDSGTGDTITSGGLLRYPLEVAIYIHSNLLLGAIGKNVIVVTGLFLLFMSLSGLYLWWPKRLKMIGKSLSIDWRGPKQKRNFQIHKVFGFYFLALFITLSTTGTLIAAKKFYLPKQQFDIKESAELGTGSRIKLEAILDNVRRQYPQGDVRVIKFLGVDDAMIRVDVIDRTDFFAGKKNQLMFESRSGKLLKNLSQDDVSTGQRIYQWLIPVHSGKFVGIPGRLVNLLTGIALLTVMTFGYLVWLQRRKRRLSKR